MSNEVVVLLSTYNGERYIPDLYSSLEKQTYTNFKLIVRDDCSTDKTLELLRSFECKIIPSSQNLGSKKSFEQLLLYALKNFNANYFMFCDQDDIWEENKIETTLQKMQETESSPKTPTLIHTNLKIVDEDLNLINNSFWNYEGINPSKNSFNNLLMQNTVTGCTVMINRSLGELCKEIPDTAIMHDWWLGLIAARFGVLSFISESTIQYRQHSDNNIGATKFNFNNLLTKFIKSYKNSDSLLSKNIAQADAFLHVYDSKLSSSEKDLLKKFIEIENSGFFKKRYILLKYNLLKQGFLRNLGLLIYV